jgi:metal-responsive CopG/Arc/MetJ family transcriptional regulator
VRSSLGQVETIRVVMDAKLRRACDRAAKKGKLNRSELVRLALREHLRRVQILDSEERDEHGYEMIPQSNAAKESDWEAEAVWPQDHGFRR